MNDPVLFANDTFERLAERRDDADWLAGELARDANRLIPVWRQRSLFAPGDAPAIATLPASMATALVAADMPPVMLGRDAGTLYFALDVSHIDDPDSHPALADIGRFGDLRRLLPLTGPQPDGAALGRDANLMAYARAMIYWGRRHRFCGKCGAATRVEHAGHRRVCTDAACATEHFPRTDTAILAAVHDGADRLLLGRSHAMRDGMRSILAGFQEPGERLEGTVAREVKEEVGLDVTDVRYYWTQPWPFPGSMMAGFMARATTFEIAVDPAELETADWYARAEVRAMVDGQGNWAVPPGTAISGRLIRAWLAGG